MRHHNIIRRTWTFSHRTGDRISSPYTYGNYSWSKPNKNRRYIQVLQFVYDHPKSSRKEIYEAIFGGTYTSGSQSALFSNMLYDDLIDYDTNYKYTISDFGMEILKKSYINDLAKTIVK